MRRAVVDASVAAKWALAEPLADVALRVRSDYELVAPSLLHAEVASALTKGVARGVLTQEEAARKMRHITRTGVEIVPDVHLCTGAVQLASTLGHSVYDCFYLHLASARHLPLITADRKLAEAARSLGGAVEVIPLEDVA